MASDETMRCLGCGYDLRGLPENRCPECGRPFDPSDSATFVCKRADGRTYLGLALLALFLVIAPIPCSVFFGAVFPGRLSRWIALGVFAVGMTSTGAVLGASIRRVREPPASVRHRVALWAALLISGLPYAAFVAWTALGVVVTIIDRIGG